MIILFLIKAVIIIVLLYMLYKSKKNKVNCFENIKKIIQEIAEGEKNQVVVSKLNDKEKELVDFFLKERDKTKCSIQETEKYKEELSTTYKTLLSKSTELEYSNSLLEKKLANMATLNAIGKSVLSEFDLQKIISIILDAYVVLVGVKKISLYLWEDEKLVNVPNNKSLNIPQSYLLKDVFRMPTDIVGN